MSNSPQQTIEEALATALQVHAREVERLTEHLRRLRAQGVTVFTPDQAPMLHVIYASGAAVDLLYGDISWENAHSFQKMTTR